MDEIIASAKKEVLVEMVKLAQKKEMAGSKGEWKEFLKVYDTKYGTSLCDPSRRNIDSLDAFLKTFTKSDDLKFFKKVMQCQSDRDKVEQFKKTSPDDETAEQKLVHLTLMHPQYPVEYCFPSYEEEWLVKKRSTKSRIMKSTKMIGIDCEMVLCEDGTEGLVRVCAIDRNLQVKLDAVVNPKKAIADYRTEITGISATELDGVTCSLPDVQESMKKLLSHGTILVGHSLYNDLQALKLDYARVIDTSYIFKNANGPTRKKPSLSLLCKAKLGYDLRKPGNPHNCLDDACAPMKLVLARLEGRIDDVISEEVKELDAGKKGLDAGRLFMHRIPVNVLGKDLQEVMPGDFTLQMKTNKNKNTCSAIAIFKSVEESNEAFENLEGDLQKDSSGRPQKLVKFKLGSGLTGSLYIRKTCHDDSVDQLKSNKRSNGDDDISGTLKKMRTDQTRGPIQDTNQCEVHLEEIQRLKEDLSHRDQEISNLNRIIAALTRKQGL